MSKRFSIKNWTSQGIRLLKNKFNSFFKCYFSKIQNQSIFKGSSRKSLIKNSIIFSKFILLQNLSKNNKIKNKGKTYKKLFFFYNFICSQFHPIQMKFQIVLIFFFNFRFFSIKFTKLQSDLQATLGSLGQFLFTNINFSKLDVC